MDFFALGMTIFIWCIWICIFIEICWNRLRGFRDFYNDIREIVEEVL